MKNYRKSDYAINRYSKSIIYSFSDSTTNEITCEIYLAQNPQMTVEDFNELKALSDEMYKEDDRAEYRQTYKNVSLHSVSETVSITSIPTDQEELKMQNKKQAMRAATELIKSNELTNIQKKRFLLYFFKGLSTRQIAEKECIRQNAVWKSIHSAEKKLKIFFKNGWSEPLENHDR